LDRERLPVQNLPVEELQVVKSTYWSALQGLFIIYACFCFAAFLVSLLLRHKVLLKEHVEHKTG
jgi:hypothetical protein